MKKILKKILAVIAVYLIGLAIACSIAVVKGNKYYDEVQELVEQGKETRTDTVSIVNRTQKSVHGRKGKYKYKYTYYAWLGEGVDTVCIRWEDEPFCKEGDTITAIDDDGILRWLPDSALQAAKGFNESVESYNWIAVLILFGCILEYLIELDKKWREKRKRNS